MSELYKTVDLGPSEEIIRSYVLANCLSPDEMTIQSKILKFGNYPNLKDFLNTNLQSFYNAIGQELTVKDGVIIFGVKPEASIRLHVDGLSLDRKHAKNYALNIPLANCDMGVMHWYNGDYTLTEQKTEEALQYLKLTWNSPPVIIDSAVIDTPTIVKVDIPHNVHNHSPKHRLILSLRFVPDIPTDW